MRRLLAAAALALLTECGATSTLSEDPATGSSEPTDAIACPQVDVRAPDGSAVDLSGIWRSDDLGVYYLRQDQACLSWLGLSDYPGRELGQDWANVFTGVIASDLTISGTSGDIDYPYPRPGPEYAPDPGQLVLHIDFDETHRPVLILPESTGSYLGHVWVPESTMPPIVEIEGLLGGRAFGCPWVESAGTRYALLQGDRVGDAQADWTLFEEEGEFQLQDRSGRVGAEVGDSIRVIGQPFPLAYCAPDAREDWEALLVETMTPNP